MDEYVLKCYRGACTNSADVRMYNVVTQGLYCRKCAALIERACERTGEKTFFPYLFEPRPPAGGQYRPGRVVIRPPTEDSP